MRFGDQILQVNDEFVTGMDCEEVVNILEKSKSERIVLAIRDRPFARTVTMHRDNAGAFGFQLYAGRIKHIVPQSSAARNGLLVDHQIIEVNGQNVVGIGNKKLTHMISCCAQTLTVTIMPYSIFEKLIKRLPSGLMRKMMDHSVPNWNMSRRKVSCNLALLKEKLGQDPESYREEFFDQFRHFQSVLQLMELQPQLKQEGLVEVVFFLCTAAQFYPEAAIELRDQLMALLKRSASDFDSPVRVALCKALLLLNTRKMICLSDLVGLFLELLKCRDKTLRMFLFTATVNRLRKTNATRRDQKLDSSLQKTFLWHLQESNALIARFSLLVLIDLYRRRIWRNDKIANGIAQASLNPVNRIAITAVRFLLGSDVTCNKAIPDDDDDDEDDDDEPASDQEDQSRRYRTLKEMLLSYRVGKKSKKRCKMLEKAKEEMRKKYQKKRQRKKSFIADMSAIEMVYDPQEFAEKLFRKLQNSRDKYEIRLLYMALISRVIMVHHLILLSFYPFLQRYLTPHQRDVTKLLLFAAHASHDLVPPDVVEALVRVIAYNFITDRNSSEAITVGLNAVREIVCRCPLAISFELMQDLAGYKKYKNKNVAMGARSLIHLFRRINPKALAKKDRGRPTVASAQQESIARPYGTRQVTSFVPGAENLTMEEMPDSGRLDENENSASDNEGSWIDVSDDDDSESDLSDRENNPTSSKAACSSPNVADEQVDRAKKAEEICSSRVLTQTEFEKIATSRIVDSVLPASRKRKSCLSNALADAAAKVARLKDIEHLHKRPKLDKQARIESVKSGRKGREDYGKRKRRGPHVGRTQRELAKRKAFSMVKHKAAKKRKNRSFRQQQQALRGYLLRQSKLR
ncbi:SDA1 and PDZ and NUC130 3NT domain containing pro tein [Trichuris trichiura]|uniref:Protein SDA1 n=1 Tax=Trichuris trichiura TaxID=36087 RepID=A0A077YVM6_TRITR|nr:SDA1 and PDZ and NUC130 3NT domain containing pro tein [Trichuris trichiura]